MLNKNILNHAILSCKHHRDLDKKTIKKFLPGYKLMENAGGEIFKIIKNSNFLTKFLIVSESIINTLWYSLIYTLKSKK